MNNAPTRVHVVSMAVLLLYFAGGANGSSLLYAQTVDIAEFEACSDCEVGIELVARLGEAEPPGIIERDAAYVVRDTASGMYAVFHRGQPHILIFDNAASFLRVVGRSGRGPGEIGALSDVEFMGDDLLALDGRNRKFVLFTPDGELILERQIDVNPGWMEVVGPDQVVVGSMNLSPDLVGYPFHLFAIRTGGSVFHFGAASANWSAARPFARDVVVGTSTRPGRVWRGDRIQMRFEEWTVEGTLLRAFAGAFDWFGDGGADSEMPRSIVLEFGVDSFDRLFVITHVPDPRWRSVERHGVEGRIERRDIATFRDSRLDVFHLSRGHHLGTLRWDEPYAGLVRMGNTYGIQRVEYDQELVPRVAVYRIRLER